MGYIEVHSLLVSNFFVRETLFNINISTIYRSEALRKMTAEYNNDKELGA